MSKADSATKASQLHFRQIAPFWGRDALVAFPICSPSRFFNWFPHLVAAPSQMPERERLPHLKPYERQSIVFLITVTFDRRPVLACDIAHEILRTIWCRAPVIDGWTVGYYVVMPDHIHLFARASRDAKPLARWVQSWKSLSSRRLMTELRIDPPVWQRDYFDRFLRSSDNYSDKWNYVAANPVRHGLVRATTEWRWQGILEDLSF